jgi:hypothetical protein
MQYKTTSLCQQPDQIVILSESEESRINFSSDPVQRNGPDMFRFTQFATGRIRHGGHDSATMK